MSLPKFPRILTISIILITLSTLAFFTPTLVSAQGATEQSVMEYLQDALTCEETGEMSLSCLVRYYMDGLLNEIQAHLFEGGRALSGGLIPRSAQTIAALYQYQPSSTEYIASVLNNLGPPRAYAQGYGYSSLNSVLEVWKAFRNIAYFAFVIMFIVVGFMIMLRTKINPQTVISLQEALPRLVITLILVTFSYAIAGFLIDLIYFLTYLVIAVFSYTNIINAPAFTEMMNQNILLAYLGRIFNLRNLVTINNSPAEGVAVAIVHLFEGIFGVLHPQGAAGDTILWIGSKLGVIIIGIMIFYALLKTFVQLLSAFISIIASVVLSPLLIMFNALPGSNAFMTWLKNLLANVLVFPGVAVFLMIAAALMGTDGLAGSNTQVTYGDSGFIPPFLGFRNADTGSIRVLIGFGVLLLLPTVAQMIKDSMKVEPFKYGKEISAAIGAGTWPIRQLYSQQQERKAMQQQEQMLKSAMSSNRA